jgi:hypothetical protein
VLHILLRVIEAPLRQRSGCARGRLGAPHGSCSRGGTVLIPADDPGGRVGKSALKCLDVCLDHVLVLHERHLQRILASYFFYYHTWRTHLALAMDCPKERPVVPPAAGKVITVPEVGGLHHHYERQAA